MPSSDFMLDVLGDGASKKANMNNSMSKSMDANDMDGLEADIDDFFDFVVIDEEMLSNLKGKKKMDPKEAVQKIDDEDKTMKETPS